MPPDNMMDADVNTSDAGFTRWLRRQKGRDDPIGDLASDYIADCRLHKVRRNASELASHLQLYGCAGARHALQAALAEYRAALVLDE